MGVGSVVLGVVSLLMMFGGILLSIVPGVGSILSFGAPVVALIGAVLGGIGMSRAKQEGESGGAGMAGLIISIIAFLFSLVFALTCGLCNALCTAGMIAGPRHRDGGLYWTTGDGGVQWNGPALRRDGGVDDTFDPGVEPAPPDPSGAPPPAFPPPPLGSSGAEPAQPDSAPPDTSATPPSTSVTPPREGLSTPPTESRPERQSQPTKQRGARRSPPPPPPPPPPG